MPGVSQRIITVPSWGTAGTGRGAVGAEPSPPLTPQAARPQAAPLLGFDLPGFAPAAPLAPEPRCPVSPRTSSPSPARVARLPWQLLFPWEMSPLGSCSLPAALRRAAVCLELISHHGLPPSQTHQWCINLQNPTFQAVSSPAGWWCAALPALTSCTHAQGAASQVRTVPWCGELGEGNRVCSPSGSGGGRQ